MTLEAVYGLVDESDPDEAYLFECDYEPLLTRDRAGTNLPWGSCLVGGRWHSMFALAARHKSRALAARLTWRRILA